MQSIAAPARTASTQQSYDAASLTRKTGIPSHPSPTQVRTSVYLQKNCSYASRSAISKVKCRLIDLIGVLPILFNALGKQQPTQTGETASPTCRYHKSVEARNALIG